MNAELIFNIFNTGILLPWILLIFLPNWKGTQKMIEWKLPVLIVGIAYLVILITNIFIIPDGTPVDLFSWTGVKAAFTKDGVMLIGWLHYLAFDLFVGMWESVDARKNGISHFLLVPCLFLTLFYGPVGFVLYWMLRKWSASKTSKV